LLLQAAIYTAERRVEEHLKTDRVKCKAPLLKNTVCELLEPKVKGSQQERDTE
jgi:hypothetical protein